MTHYQAESDVPFTREQMFDLVADVESYPRFVPWWIDAKITGVTDGYYQTIQTMGLGPIRLRFPSRTKMVRPERIEVNAQGGGLKTLVLIWTFEERAEGCHVHLGMDMTMASRTLDKIVGRLSRDAAKTLVDAFRRRAYVLYKKEHNTPREQARRA